VSLSKINLNIKISQGGTHDCYLHPADDNLCVKTARLDKFTSRTRGLDNFLYFLRHLKFKTSLEDVIQDMSREIKIYKIINKLLPGRVAKIYNLVETDKGPGLECELVRDFDGSASPDLYKYFKSGHDPQKLLKGLDWIAKRIIMRDLFFLDFNRGNFAAKTLSDNKIIIIIIDLKSLNRTGFQGFLHLERILSPLARIIMYRRLKRLYKSLNLEFKLNNLCRKKFLSNLIVKIRI